MRLKRLLDAEPEPSLIRRARAKLDGTDLSTIDRSKLRVTAPPGRVSDCPRCTEKCCRAPHRVRLRLEDVARLFDAGLEHAVEPPRDETDPPLLAQRRGACVFLTADERCGIHPIRPLSCRAFPVQLSEDRTTLRFSNACPSWVEGRDAEARALLDSAFDAHEARRRELTLLRSRREDVRALGLLGPFPQRGASFEAILKRHTSGSKG